MSKATFGFSKAEKLKSRKQIALLFSTGRRFTQTPYQVCFLSSKTQPGIMVGFGVSNRNFKKAVDRNRIKRLGREAYRLSKQILVERAATTQTGLSVFFIYTARELPKFEEVLLKMKAILARLEKECI
jgi:ribonuclease P protein component